MPPKPQGDRALTAAERQARRRQARKAEVQQLRAELDACRAENERLRQAVANREEADA